MIKIPDTVPVKTRLPASAWAIAALVTLFSLASTVARFPQASQDTSSSFEHATQQTKVQDKAKV
jgi:hypothetical protein